MRHGGSDGREELEIRVAEARADGAGNEAVVKLVARALAINRSEVSITSGYANRHKRVAVPFEVEELRRGLGGQRTRR